MSLSASPTVRRTGSTGREGRWFSTRTHLRRSRARTASPAGTTMTPPCHHDRMSGTVSSWRALPSSRTDAVSRMNAWLLLHPTDTGRRTAVTGSPAHAAAEAFGHTAPQTLAEANAARALAAKAFPKSEQKPPTFDLAGQTRSTAIPTQPRHRDDDHSR